jgi:hypothetical protein
VVLTDDGIPSNGTGQFGAVVMPTVDGRYTGVITVEHVGGATIADAATLMLHSEKDELSIEVKAPPFVRRIPFSFEIGPTRLKDDQEDPTKWEMPVRRVKPEPDRKLVSAKLHPR